jgi:hypothetical protein
MIAMWRGLQIAIVIAAVCGMHWGSAAAQGTAPAPGQGEQNFKQVKLTNKLVEGFLGAQRDMADFAEKNKAQPSDKPDPKIQAQLDELAKKHGFESFAQFDDVAFNISMVMGGLDPQTGKFTDPVAAIKQEIEDVKADKSIGEKDKKQMLEELNEALKNTPPLQYPENVEVVKQYREQIEQVLQ